MLARVCCAVLAILPACSASPPADGSLPSTGVTPQRSTHGSWMAPDAKRSDLLYVTDYETNDVDAYSYPDGKLRGVLKGVLKGFVLETGPCSDATGNVFIPDSSNSTVLEYAHGSTKVARTLLDRNEYPYACAVDGHTGDLAVVDYESVSGAGGVSIYPRARGRPKTYRYGFIYKFYFAAYDSRGNLFVDASYDVPSEPVAFVELPAGGQTLQSIALDHPPKDPGGGVAWDGKNVVIGDSNSAVLYRFAIAGSQGTQTGSTRLDRGRFITQFFIANGAAVGANYRGRSVALWPYPRGGASVGRIAGLGEPFGVTLSRAAR
jgi:hypothetical protein